MDIGLLLFVFCFALWQVLTLNHTAYATSAQKSYAAAILRSKINKMTTREPFRTVTRCANGAIHIN